MPAPELRTERHSLIDAQSVRLLPYSADWADLICSWAPSGVDLRQISGEAADRLSPALLEKWVDRSAGGFLLQFRRQIIAFATASRAEWEFPDRVCEICHLLVAPRQRQRYHGSFFVNWLAHLMVGSGYESVVARANPDNEPALGLLHYLRWREVGGQKEWATGPFCWFEGPAKRWS